VCGLTAWGVRLNRTLQDKVQDKSKQESQNKEPNNNKARRALLLSLLSVIYPFVCLKNNCPHQCDFAQLRPNPMNAKTSQVC